MFASLIVLLSCPYSNVFADTLGSSSPSSISAAVGPGLDGSVTVPFTYSLGHIIVPIVIDGHGPFPSVLDTGGRLVITPDFAASNDISSAGSIPMGGIGAAAAHASIAEVKNISIGGVNIANPLMLVVPLPTQRPIIGFELFKEYVVRVDFDKDLLTLIPSKSYKYSGTGTVVPFRFLGHMPEVDGVLDGVTGLFTIDTGSDHSLDLLPKFVAEHSLVAKYNPAFSFTSSFGLGGSQRSSVARATTFSIGTASEQNIVIELSLATGGAYTIEDIAGNVGTGFLRRFNVTFDYARQRIIFQPNSHFAEPDSYERLGVIVDAAPEGMIVSDVIIGSPAAIAGITVGDVITAINSQPVGVANIELFFNSINEPAGTQLTLTVLESAASRDVDVTLKDLI